MSVLSWEEIRNRALAFQNEWKDETNENAEAKSFWDDFFNVFGVSRRRVATFEEGVKIEGNTKFVDLLWKGTLLIEHKSKGKNLDRAYDQAINYFDGIKDRDLPRYVLVSDFERFRLYDLDNKINYFFQLEDFYKNIQLFSFIAGYEHHEIKPQDPVNTEAAVMMGKIHDELQKINYVGDDLDTLLVRLVFCLFADDTGIFNKGLFRDFLENNTNEDGTDLAINLQYLFEILDTPLEQRITSNSIYDEFPYVNGSLFKKRLRTAVFNKSMREILLECSRLDWGKISPAIFGSLFQSAMDQEKRRSIGAHYTSEENIMRIINPLFLDDLKSEFEEIKKRKRNKLKLLEQFQDKLSNLTFLDPACGSGNFLILAYREIRRLELDVLKEINYTENKTEAFQLDLSLDFNNIIKCNVDQFFGIEIDSFSAQIAQVALWIVDHQMNIEASLYFGRSFARLPLSEHANIVNNNALEVNWVDVLDPRDCNFILGNPPFIGKKYQTTAQRNEMKAIFDGVKGYKSLDYVTGWFYKAAQYIQMQNIKVGFVATSSISQGEQVSILWNELFDLNMEIIFAYKPFKWSNDAKHNAGVYVVITGFRYENKQNTVTKKIYDGDKYIEAKNINGYLVDAKNVSVKRRGTPIQKSTKKMIAGNKPVDYNHLKLTEDEFEEFRIKEPKALKYIKRLYGAQEFIQGKVRYCLWLVDCPPNELAKMPMVLERVRKTKEARLASRDKGARKLADKPTVFRETNNPKQYIIIPSVSSENRNYIPMGFLGKNDIPVMSVLIIPDGDLYDFGILTSKMHMVWTNAVCGRLEMRYRYSSAIVYNNFPFPKANDELKEKISKLSLEILRIKEKYEESTLSDLYNLLTMPYELLKAHQKLDREVEKLYRVEGFENDSDRLSYLFNLYSEIVK